MEKDSLVNSYNAILVGVSFVTLAFVQTILEYYKNTSEPVNILLLIIIFALFIPIALLLKEMMDKLLEKSEIKTYIIQISSIKLLVKDHVGSCIGIIVLVIAFLMFITAPTPHIAYGFYCSDFIRDQSLNSYDNTITIAVENNGQLNTKFIYSILSDSNLTFYDESDNQVLGKSQEITIPSSHKLADKINIFIKNVDFNKRNLSINLDFICKDNGCVATKYINSKQNCFYKKEYNDFILNNMLH